MACSGCGGGVGSKSSSQHTSLTVAVWQDSKLNSKGSDPFGGFSGQITGLQVAREPVL